MLRWPGRAVDYTQDDKDAVLEAMNADPQTQGKYLEKFEEVFSNYHEGRKCFAVSSGAAALEISAMLLRLKPGDEVIIPAHTYCATALPFARRGVKIKWADIKPGIRTVTAETIEPLITKKTKAIVVVHLYGVSAPMHCILRLARSNNITVVEDCAQSLGATYEYKRGWGQPDSETLLGKSGTHGDISIYSFHGQKNLTTLGEGGMVSTYHESYAKLIPGLRHNGHRQTGDKKVVDFDTDEYPYNFSIGEVQCAVGISQMSRLQFMNHKRYNNARKIIDSLEDIEDLVFQKIPKGGSHVYHLLCARFPFRDRLMKILWEQFKIECVVQYAPLYKYPLFRDYREADCPNTEDFHSHALSFPFAEWYTCEQIDYLIESIRKAVRLA